MVLYRQAPGILEKTKREGERGSEWERGRERGKPLSPFFSESVATRIPPNHFPATFFQTVESDVNDDNDDDDVDDFFSRKRRFAAKTNQS